MPYKLLYYSQRASHCHICIAELWVYAVNILYKHWHSFMYMHYEYMWEGNINVVDILYTGKSILRNSKACVANEKISCAWFTEKRKKFT